MGTRWLLNIAMAVLVAALGLFVYFRPGADKPAGPPLTGLTPEAVMTIRIERAKPEIISLARADTGWRMTAPVRARANTFNIDSLLRVTTAPSLYQTTAIEPELARYGLAPNDLRLWFNDEEIHVGAIHPMKQQHYVRYRNSVHLIPSHVLASAFLGYASFIDTQLLEDERQLVALRLPGLQLVRTDGSWRREPPDKKRDEQVSGDHVNEFVAHWQNAHALSVERLSTRPALERIQLVYETNGQSATLTLEVLAYKPEFVLARRDEGLEYHFPEDIGRQLLNFSAE